MPHRDDGGSLRHLLNHAIEASDMVAIRARSDLDNDRMLNLALVRLVDVMGEAARRVSPATRMAQPQIPWAEIVGTRDRLIHGYDAVDFDILWQILKVDLPPLIAALEQIAPPERR